MKEGLPEVEMLFSFYNLFNCFAKLGNTFQDAEL
jgi:hypothetical protein